jgi:cellulose synthase/poly-beta-1,6-N-acetylglucosamine synthase-like glycosyltransferase
LGGNGQLKQLSECASEGPNGLHLVCGWFSVVLIIVVAGSLGMSYRVSTFIAAEDALLRVGVCSSRKRYRLRPRSPLASATSAVPGVSILRPLKGLDTNLYENLESTFIQEYPNYEIIMSVADEYDQALSVITDLLVKYPNVNARVIIGRSTMSMTTTKFIKII